MASVFSRCFVVLYTNCISGKKIFTVDAFKRHSGNSEMVVWVNNDRATILILKIFKNVSEFCHTDSKQLNIAMTVGTHFRLKLV